MDDCEGLKALSFKALLAEGKEKEENFGLEVGDAEDLESGREGIRIADIEETAIEMELGYSLFLPPWKEGLCFAHSQSACRLDNYPLFFFFF